MKKIIALVLALVMCMSLAACGKTEGKAGDSGLDTSDLPSYKVGVILYDLSNAWALQIMDAIEYVGDELNIEFEYAIGGTDPEQTITAAQNFGAAGCDGILNLHPGTIMSSLIDICEEYGMFIVTSNDPANGSADYADFSKSEYFAGEVWEDDYQMAYDIVTDMINEQGAKTFALHGFPEGLSTQMDKRLAGARAAIKDLGATIVTEGLSFDKAGAAENIVSQFPDVDAIFSSVETVSTVYQPLVNAKLGEDILLNCYDPDEGTVEAMEEGVINYAVEGTRADSMIALILLYNAMSGNRMTAPDGTAASIEMKYVLAKDAESFGEIQKYITVDDYPFYATELADYITVLNKDASFEGLSEFAQTFSLEDVMSRHQ